VYMLPNVVFMAMRGLHASSVIVRRLLGCAVPVIRARFAYRGDTYRIARALIAMLYMWVSFVGWCE
jgi:hypothetical protein